MKLKKSHWLGIIFSVITLLMDIIFFLGDRIFVFLVGIAVMIIALPFLINLIVEGKREKEKNEKFLEFSRNLAENVKSGTPIAKSIMNLSTKDFGTLTPNVKKLANQIALGIPISQAFQTFAYDVDSNTVKRAVTTIQEAESAGGEIEYILESVAQSVYQVEKLKKERQAAVSSLVVQGYIIFFIFVGIMLVMQFKILPITAGVGSIGSIDSPQQTEASAEQVQELTAGLARPFLYLLIVQGLFAGLIIGKLSEGSVKSGAKHSIVLTLAALLISSGANAFL